MSVLLLVEHHKDNEKTITTFFIHLNFECNLKILSVRGINDDWFLWIVNGYVKVRWYEGEKVFEMLNNLRNIDKWM